MLVATGEGTGAVSWLNYAFRLMYLPIGLFGVSIATAALPAVSRQHHEEDRGDPDEHAAEGMAEEIRAPTHCWANTTSVATTTARAAWLAPCNRGST